MEVTFHIALIYFKPRLKPNLRIPTQTFLEIKFKVKVNKKPL
jgi:hypothetical protein